MKLLPFMILTASACAQPAVTAPCRLAWDPAEHATEYRVWRGLELVATVPGTEATVQLSAEHLSTLTVTARNATAESAGSIPLTVRPVRSEVSADLQSWSTGSVFFIADTPELFLRFATPGPDANNLPAPTMSFQPFKGFFPFVPPVPAGGGGGGTDWTASANLFGWYRFEGTGGTSAMGADSTALGNHADDNSGSGLVYPASSADAISGSQSGDFETAGTDSGCVLSMSNASSGFPCKTGGTTSEMTWAGWVKLESSSTNAYIAGIGSNRQYLRQSSQVLGLSFTGSSQVTITADTSISLATWYFVAGVYSDSADKAWIYVRALGSGSSEFKEDIANIGPLENNTYFAIGARLDAGAGSCWDGQIDELCIFDRAFTQAELDAVFANGWSGSGW